VRPPKKVAAMRPIVMAGTRPTRSATIDQGMTATARPKVDADTVNAAADGVVGTPAAIAGSTACVA
jgi:hypothetical protein